MEWLSNHIEPWKQVYEYWIDTYKARNKLLMQEKQTVYDYLNKFPCLRLNKGHNLVSTSTDMREVDMQKKSFYIILYNYVFTITYDN